MAVDTPALPNNVGELRLLIQQMRAEHYTQVQSLQASLQAERNERIEYQNKALEYFEELQLMRRRPRRKGRRPLSMRVAALPV